MGNIQDTICDFFEINDALHNLYYLEVWHQQAIIN